MEEEKEQKELFEFEKPKRSFPKLSKFLPKSDFERNILITLSLEKVIFIVIGVILLVVAVYAIGVEAGRSKPVSQALPAVSQRPQQLLPVKAPQQAVQALQAAQAAIPAEPFIIVAGAYSRKDNALSTMIRLKQAGFNAYLGQTQPLYQVWVGGARTSADAFKELIKVRRLCKDAYIKTRQVPK